MPNFLGCFCKVELTFFCFLSEQQQEYAKHSCCQKGCDVVSVTSCRFGQFCHIVSWVLASVSPLGSPLLRPCCLPMGFRWWLFWV